MQNKMNMKNKIHKCVPKNNKKNLSAQSWSDIKTSGTRMNTGFRFFRQHFVNKILFFT